MLKTKKRTARTDLYLKRVQEFPLVPIRHDRHLAQAIKVINKLIQTHLDESEEEYLDVLTTLVEDYEEEHHAIPDSDEASLLKHLLEAKGVTVRQTAEATGVAISTLTGVQKRKATLNKDDIVALSRYFHVSPSVFFPEPQL